MKRMIVIFMLLLLLLLLVPATPVIAGEKDSHKFPPVVVEIVRNRDFFARKDVLRGYEDCALTDVMRLSPGKIGIELIEPSGFQLRLVYDVESLDVLYREAVLPSRERREFLRLESVSVADVVKLATFAVLRGGGEER